MENKKIVVKNFILIFILYYIFISLVFRSYGDYRLTVDSIDAKICASNLQIISLGEDVHYITKLSHTSSYLNNDSINKSNYLLTHGLIKDSHTSCPSSDISLFWVTIDSYTKDIICIVHSDFSFSRSEFINNLESIWLSMYLPSNTNSPSSGNDILKASSFGFSTHITGKSGNDIIYDNESSRVIDSGSGNDLIIGRSNNNTLNGGRDNDVIVVGANDDIVNGGSGNDFIFSGVGSNSIDGGLGVDIVYYSGSFPDYSFSKKIKGKYTISNSSDGITDTLSQVEIIKFSDSVTIDLRAFIK